MLKQIVTESSWFASRVNAAQKAPTVEIATITPEIAKHILENNADNRPVRKRLLNKIIADINEGRWELNGESIVISKTGELNDGQHRLLGCVETRKPIDSVLVFGMERRTRLTVDVGTARTAGDFLGMSGAEHKASAAATAKLLLSVKAGGYGGEYTPGAIQALYWSAHKKIDRACALVAEEPFFKRYGGAPLSAAHVLTAPKSLERAEQFFAKLATGERLSAGSPILALRDRLVELHRERRRPWHKLELILRYWNAFIDGDKIERKIPLQNKFPPLSRSLG